MTQRVQELLFASGIAVVFAVYAYLSTNFGPNARLIPLPMAALGFALTVAQLLRLATGRERLNDDAEERAEGRVKSGNRELLALGGIVSLVALVLLLGPVVAIYIFTAAYLFVSGHFPLVRSLVIAAVFTLALFALFALGLQLELYHGILEPLFDTTT